jgi:hypothetical protein
MRWMERSLKLEASRDASGHADSAFALALALLDAKPRRPFVIGCSKPIVRDPPLWSRLQPMSPLLRRAW